MSFKTSKGASFGEHAGYAATHSRSFAGPFYTCAYSGFRIVIDAKGSSGASAQEALCREPAFAPAPAPRDERIKEKTHQCY